VRTYSTETLPHYVKDWFGVRRLSDIRMTKAGRDTWHFDANGRHVEIKSRTAMQARDRLREIVCHEAPKKDERRIHWVYT
jgi:hypothetical protein